MVGATRSRAKIDSALRLVQTPTVNTIAERVGVAACTVSSVLNGQAQSRRIHVDTARRIMEEAERLNYVPNILARGLRSRRTSTIGVLVVNFGNNWTERLMAGIEPVINAHNSLPLILLHRSDATREVRELNLLAQRRVDGILTVPLVGNEKVYESFVRRGVPIVFLADTLETTPDFSFAAWDSEIAAGKAVEHLLQIGRRRIAFIFSNWPTLINSRRRAAGERALRDAGMKVNPDWRTVVTDEALIFPFLQKTFTAPGPKPDAIYCNDDGVGFAVVEGLYRLGVKVPDEVAVVGMGDLPRGSETGVGLTSMHEPVEEIGRLAAETLFRLIENPQQEPIQHLIPGVDLKIRRTTVGSVARRAE